MKKLLMLGTSYASCEMIKKAREKGVYTIVTDYREPEKSKGKLIADEYWMIDTSDVEQLEKKCREEQIDGIVCGVSEFNMERVIELTQRLGLPCYCTPESWKCSSNKYEFKKLCKKTGVRVAEDYHVSNPPTKEELSKIKYPVVVKAINLTANRGMSYCYNEEELLRGCEYARKASGSDTIIVERMLHGQQLSALYVMADGEISLLSFESMNYQPGGPRNCYTVTTTESKYLYRFLSEMNDDIIELLKQVGCREGFGWIEIIVDQDDKMYLLEMGYRLAGDEIQDTLKNIINFDVHEWTFDYALGNKHRVEDLPLSQHDYFDRCGCVYLLWSNQSAVVGSMTGIEKILENDNIRWDSWIPEGDTIREYAPVGQFIFDTKDIYEMCEMIKAINETVSIKNTEGEEMVIHYTDYQHLIDNSREHAER